MEDTPMTPTAAEASQPTRRPPRRRPAARPKSAAPARPAARKKAAAPSASADFRTRARSAKKHLAKISENGARSARRAIANVKGLSKKTAKRLARDWQDMNPRRRAQLVATLVAALGAAAVPLVRAQLKKH